MGGIIFIFSFLVTVFLFAPQSYLLWISIVIVVLSALLGFIDDFSKVAARRSLGLKARQKILGQLIFSIIFYAVLFQLGHSTLVKIPFTPLEIELGFFYPVLIFLLLSGFSNAVNLTDGIDGLAAGTAILVLLAFLLLASWQGLQEIVYFNGILIGACFGFLVYNLHPAKIFMGDVGSLSLGTALAVVAVLTKSELYLLVIGGVFVLETLSVMLQVASYRLTGKRIFLMSPLHHHFELKGWSEWQVVIGFWALGFIFALIGLLEYSIK